MSDLDRPRFHFTVPSGWINDPYGVTWWQGGYHLFFQFNPEAPPWTSRMCWGQASSPDLVRWSAPTIALAPSGDEAGCWSGAVVLDRDRPAMFYTSVDSRNQDLGRIVAVRSDATFQDWRREPAPIVEAPHGLAVTHYRDPYLWRADDGWRMVVGGGLEPQTGAIFGYSSPDLREWTFRGILCSRPAELIGTIWTGSVWECPQLFELDGAWVVVVSVAHVGVTRIVVYAVGDFDGTTFSPQRWHRLLHGDAPYATTTFLDANGRRCALSWSRKDGPVRRRKWAGAMSTPLVLRRDGERVFGSPHPDVDGMRSAISSEHGNVPLGPEPFRVGAVGAQGDVVMSGRLAVGDRLHLALLQAGARVLAVVVADDVVTLCRPDHPDEPMPLGATADGYFELRLLLDASLVEVFTAGGVAGVRIAPVAVAGDLYVAAERGRPAVDRLLVHEMTPVPTTRSRFGQPQEAEPRQL